MQHTKAGSKLRALADVAIRLDNLGHCLAWARKPASPVHEWEVSSLEFPRLKLSFELKNNKLMCNEHSGYFLACDGMKGAQEIEHMAHLLAGFAGASVLLCDSKSQMAILANGRQRPFRAMKQNADFVPSQVLFDRRTEMELYNSTVHEDIDLTEEDYLLDMEAETPTSTPKGKLKAGFADEDVIDPLANMLQQGDSGGGGFPLSLSRSFITLVRDYTVVRFCSLLAFM